MRLDLADQERSICTDSDRIDMTVNSRDQKRSKFTNSTYAHDKTVDLIVWQNASRMSHAEEKYMDRNNTLLENRSEKHWKTSLSAKFRFAMCAAVSIPLMHMRLAQDKF